uniref:Uncharacterized protein n=1 Tax=uncultured marine virus TaxID=186617 RepID=S4TFC6_9VIRU|nr:hypothetical protein [uncultured marine virus]
MPRNLLNVILSQVKEEPDSEKIAFFNKYNSIHMEESEELIKRKFRKILSQEYQLERMGSFAQQLLILETQNEVLIKEKRAIKTNSTHIFITINAWTEKITLQKFLAKCHKISKKTCFKNVLYAFEQRGTIDDNTVGKGYHCHLLVERNVNYKVCKCIDNTKKSCTPLVKNVNARHLLNFQVIGQEFAKDKKNYIIGQNKTGDKKDIKQVADIEWRKSNDIKSFYGDENII